MGEMWIVNIVQNDVPTEYSVGPFYSAEEASKWVDVYHNDTWMRVQTVKLYNPYQ